MLAVKNNHSSQRHRNTCILSNGPHSHHYSSLIIIKLLIDNVHYHTNALRMQKVCRPQSSTVLDNQAMFLEVGSDHFEQMQSGVFPLADAVRSVIRHVRTGEVSGKRFDLNRKYHKKASATKK